MAKSYIDGSDGTASIAGGFGIEINAWRASFTRPVTDHSAFGDTGRRRKLGNLTDVQGSLSGTLAADASTTSPNIDHTNRDGSLVTLTPRSASTSCSWTFTAVVSNQSFDCKLDGDLTASYDFMLSGGAIPTEAWDES